MQIRTIDGHNACCEARGVRRDVNLFMLGDQEIAIGDFVLVHVGYAIQKISAEHARQSWALLDEISDTLTRSAGPVGPGSSP